MKRTDDFTDLCMKLEKGCGKQCERNEIKCARLAVNEYINGDHDRYLKLKVDAEECLDTLGFNVRTMEIINFEIVSLTFLTLVAGSEKMNYIFLFAFVLLLIHIGLGMKRYTKIGKWRKYILAVLDECKI